MNHQKHESLSFGVVILAAGSSKRMGQPKLLLLWKSTTVLGHLIQCWQALRARQIAVVTAKENQPVWNELNRLQFSPGLRIINPEPDRGMFSSIQCAAGWKGWSRELTHWLVTLGDQPHLRHETLQALLDFGAANPTKICQPIRKGRYRHPVLIPRAAFESLAQSSVSTLKEFLKGQVNDVAGFESPDEGLDLDMDTPADYEKLRALH